MSPHREMYCLIRTWEFDMKETFFDENESIIKKHTLLFWLLGKKYINQKQFNYWINRLEDEPYYYTGLSDIFYDDFSNSMSVLYPIIDINNSLSIELQMKIYIISELLTSLGIYIERVKKSFEDHKIEFDVPQGWKEELEEEFKEIEVEVKKLLK